MQCARPAVAPEQDWCHDPNMTTLPDSLIRHQTVTLSFFRFASVSDRIWAFGRMGTARRPLSKVPGIGFHKMLGTGTGQGFTPYPNWGVYAILAVWEDLDTAREQISEARVFRRHRAVASENYTVFLSAVRARGQWAGTKPFAVGEDWLPAKSEALAVLTRASIKPRYVLDFWNKVPNISSEIPNLDRLRFKMGLGEIPWLHQVTFSIWDNKASMDAFAYSSWHGAAAKAALKGKWFSEELFARFRVLDDEGVWGGQSPIPDLRLTA